MQNVCWLGLATLTKDHLIFHKYFSHFLLYSLLNVLNSEFGRVKGSKLSLTLSIRRGCFQEPPGILLLWNNLYYTCFICSDTGGFGSELFDPPLNKAASLLTKPGAHPGGYLLCYCMFGYSHNVYFWIALSFFSTEKKKVMLLIDARRNVLFSLLVCFFLAMNKWTPFWMFKISCHLFSDLGLLGRHPSDNFNLSCRAFAQVEGEQEQMVTRGKNHLATENTIVPAVRIDSHGGALFRIDVDCGAGIDPRNFNFHAIHPKGWSWEGPLLRPWSCKFSEHQDIQNIEIWIKLDLKTALHPHQLLASTALLHEVGGSLKLQLQGAKRSKLLQESLVQTIWLFTAPGRLIWHLK